MAKAIFAIKGDLDLGFDVHEYNFVDAAWLLSVLSALNPEHLYFSKGYLPAHPKGVRQKGRQVLM